MTENHIRRLGFVQKFDIWFPHKLKETHLTQRINIWYTPFKRNAIDTFLNLIINCDEKWIVYNKVNRKKSQFKHDEPAQIISLEKIMLLIWWDYKGVMYFELLPYNQTMNSDIYCQ